MNKEMTKWLSKYERMRTDPYSECKIPSYWHSSKFDLENMDWNSIREIYIPELDCKFGGACEALRKSWYHYKRLKKEGDRGWDIILRINKIQHALGIEMTEFRDGPDLSWVKEQLDLEEGTGVEISSEDLELRYEDDQENRLWDEMSGDYEHEKMSPEEIQLRKEEREDLLAQLNLEE